MVALADQVAGHPLGLINPALYKMSALGQAAGIVDVTKGNNTVSFPQGGKVHTVTGFRARPGYDLASGVGTVNAARFVPELAKLAVLAAGGCRAWPWHPTRPTPDPSGRPDAPNMGYEHTGRARIPPGSAAPPRACGRPGRAAGHGGPG